MTLAKEHNVRIEPHGRTLRVREDQSVLEVALAAGLNLPHSCRSGHCASCRARLLAGEIHYPNGRTAGLTAEEAASGYVLLCQARPRSDLRVEARIIANVSEAEIKTLPCRIARMGLLAPDVMQVFLRLPAVEPLQFRAGQYLDVLVDGSGKRRSFSIASPPHESGEIELHIRHVPGGGFTSTLFEKLQAGALLRIEGPLGQFTYREGASPVLMIAGGTGFAPIKSILRHALEKGAKRPIHLYWGARHSRDLYEEQTVLEWVKQHPNLSFTAVLSEANTEEIEHEHRRTGWVHDAVLADYPNLGAVEVYAAGPPAMIEAIRATFPARGLTDDRLHFDSFDYAPR